MNIEAFDPEFAGNVNFYLSAVNHLLRVPMTQHWHYLYKTKERIIAEYALRDVNQPICISKYRLAESLPEKLQGSCRRLSNWRLNSAAKSSRPKTRTKRQNLGGDVPCGRRLPSLVSGPSESGPNCSIRAKSNARSALFCANSSRKMQRSRAVWSNHKVQNQIR